MAADLLELTLATDVRETPAGVLVPTLVVHRFLAVTAPPRESPVEVDELSPREREVLRLVADGPSEPTRRARVSSDPA